MGPSVVLSFRTMLVCSPYFYRCFVFLFSQALFKSMSKTRARALQKKAAKAGGAAAGVGASPASVAGSPAGVEGNGW